MQGHPAKKSLRDAAVAVLRTADAAAKASAARALAARWRAAGLSLQGEGTLMPDRPSRPARPELRAPGAMPRRRAGGTARNRVALLHAIAHIELNAIDLAVDIAGRWGPRMPPAFTDDWLKVADEEAQHFMLLSGLLQGMGAAYGDLPAHDGLWQAAEATSHSLEARLALVPLVLEARGLDVTPAMIARFEAQGETEAASALKRILADEIGHVETGARWFRKLCSDSMTEPAERFQLLVKTHFRGAIKPPFNDSARVQAGLATDWYSSLGSAVMPSTEDSRQQAPAS